MNINMNENQAVRLRRAVRSRVAARRADGDTAAVNDLLPVLDQLDGRVPAEDFVYAVDGPAPFVVVNVDENAAIRVRRAVRSRIAHFRAQGKKGPVEDLLPILDQLDVLVPADEFSHALVAA